MKVAFISGPYRASTPYAIKQNIRNAESVAIDYWKKGYAVICPHKNTSLFDGLADDKVWLDGDLEILSRCDAIIMLPNWKESEGAISEHQFAITNGIEVVYYPPKQEEMF